MARPLKPDRSAAPLAGTLMACTAVLLAFLWASFALTGKFEHWTFEDRRRDDARQGRLVAPTIQVATAQGTAQTLWARPTRDHGVTLVSFIYTACPTVCQALGAEFTQMQEVLKARSGAGRQPIRLVSLSFDGERDGLPQLAVYAAWHHADAEVWTIATPLTTSDAGKLLRALGVVVIPDGTGGYVHNGAIQLLNASGTVLAIYDDADWKQALAQALQVSQRTR